MGEQDRGSSGGSAENWSHKGPMSHDGRAGTGPPESRNVSTFMIAGPGPPKVGSSSLSAAISAIPPELSARLRRHTFDPRRVALRRCGRWSSRTGRHQQLPTAQVPGGMVPPNTLLSSPIRHSPPRTRRPAHAQVRSRFETVEAEGNSHSAHVNGQRDASRPRPEDQPAGALGRLRSVGPCP